MISMLWPSILGILLLWTCYKAYRYRIHLMIGGLFSSRVPEVFFPWRNPNRIYEWMSKKAKEKKYQAFRWTFPPFVNRIHITDSDDLKFIMTKKGFADFEKADIVKSTFGPLLQEGIFASDGKKWKE